ncbi:hypothetical protein B0T20DRAFT_406131 [Sordaria brevicollis]|uniref:Uncharacterized protein n=1 Tax=Sordaria brevicollis TaxID=83679 RepID=A0AAE0PKE9_SORBR|nr:hypothetical protein B0T20DRAFT_406131 [Sordaria brevicollis]
MQHSPSIMGSSLRRFSQIENKVWYARVHMVPCLLPVLIFKVGGVARNRRAVKSCLTAYHTAYSQEQSSFLPLSPLFFPLPCANPSYLFLGRISCSECFISRLPHRPRLDRTGRNEIQGNRHTVTRFAMQRDGPASDMGQKTACNTAAAAAAAAQIANLPTYLPACLPACLP